jgi:hypothetical protein
MSNGSQSHTKATQVQIGNDGTIQVDIEVDAFMPGESVEISGYVTQNHGAFATINKYETINTKLGEIANLTVTATPVEGSNPFQQGHDVTVFLWASKVWVTVLGEGQAQPQGMPPLLAGPGAVWGKPKGEAGPERYSDTSEGNQSGSTDGVVGQAASAEPSSSEAG